MSDGEHVAGPGMASAQARTYLAANPIDPEQVLNSETLQDYRADASADFIPRAKRMLSCQPVTTRDVVVGGVDCIEVVPDDIEPVGTVLYCYGGGFISGSAFEDLIIAAPLAACCGARIVLPKYPLAPEHPWPAAIDAGFAVYRALIDDRSGGPIAIAGESAGGNMALALLHRARRDALAMPCASAVLSPWCDLDHGGDSLTANDGRDPTLANPWLEAAAAMYAGDRDRASPDISPLNGPFDGTYPTTMITTGTRDLLMSQAVRLTRVLREAGVPVDLRIWDDLWHVFEFYDELPEAELSVRQIGEFLKRSLTAAAAKQPGLVRARTALPE